MTGDGYYWGSCYEFNYDLTELISADDLGGTHTITVWVNGGSVQPLGSLTDFNETFYEKQLPTITLKFHIFTDVWIRGHLTISKCQY